MNTKHFSLANLVLIALLAVSPSHAVIINYTSLATYTAATGPQTLVSFAGLPNGTPVNNQFSALGVSFTDGNDVWNSPYLDGGGPDFGRMELTFSDYHYSIGIHFPGALVIDLFDGLNFLGSSANFGGQGTGFFGGISTDVAFNRAILRDHMDDFVFIQDVRFDTAVNHVPEPATLLMTGLGIALLTLYRRARQS